MDNQAYTIAPLFNIVVKYRILQLKTQSGVSYFLLVSFLVLIYTVISVLLFVIGVKYTIKNPLKSNTYQVSCLLLLFVLGISLCIRCFYTYSCLPYNFITLVLRTTVPNMYNSLYKNPCGFSVVCLTAKGAYKQVVANYTDLIYMYIIGQC